jgi:DNA-binding NarL/FixJ family response regulator
VRIGMIEDNAVLRAGMRQVVARRGDWEWVWEADTFAAGAAGPPSGCDLVLLDLGLPDGNGLDLIAGLRQWPGTHVLVFSVLGDETSVLRAIELGAAGYLLKESAPAEIIEAIDNVLAGGAPLTPSVAAHLLRRLRQPAASHTAAAPEAVGAAGIDMLTARERDVLLALARGYSYDEAAELLGISRHTVGHHVKHIYSKLAVNSKSEAVFEAMQAGWLGRHES